MNKIKKLSNTRPVQILVTLNGKIIKHFDTCQIQKIKSTFQRKMDYTLFLKRHRISLIQVYP